MKRMIKASSTHDKIAYPEQRISDIRDRLSDFDLSEDEREDLGMELASLEDELNFAWQDDEAEYNYALQQQEFYPDGRLKGYDDVEGADDIDSVNVSQCSFDFVNDGKYDTRKLEEVIRDAFSSAAVTPVAVDFRSVDYSSYKEYDGKIVSQCGVDFEWEADYYPEAIEDEVASSLDMLGYELIGMTFDSLD